MGKLVGWVLSADDARTKKVTAAGQSDRQGKSGRNARLNYTTRLEVWQVAQYKVCKRCGAHLDYGERCDCEEDTHDQPEIETAHRPRARKRKSLAELNDLAVEQAWNEFDMR